MLRPSEIPQQSRKQIVETLSNGNFPQWRPPWPSRRPMTPMYALAFRQSGVAWTSFPACSYSAQTGRVWFCLVSAAVVVENRHILDVDGDASKKCIRPPIHLKLRS